MLRLLTPRRIDVAAPETAATATLSTARKIGFTLAVAEALVTLAIAVNFGITEYASRGWRFDIVLNDFATSSRREVHTVPHVTHWVFIARLANVREVVIQDVFHEDPGHWEGAGQISLHSRAASNGDLPGAPV